MDYQEPPFKDADQTGGPTDVSSVAGVEPSVSLGSGSFLDFHPNQIQLPSWLSKDEADEIKLEGLVTAGRNRKMAVDAIKDDVAARMIAGEQTKAQARTDELSRKLEEAEAALTRQAPQMSPNVSLNPEEQWASLIQGLVTGDFAGAMNLGHSAASERQKIEFANQMRQFGLDEQAAERLWRQVGQELGQSRQHQDRLGAAAIERQTQVTKDEQDWERFQEELGLKKDREARIDREARVDNFNKNILAFWDRIVSLPEEERKVIVAQRQALIDSGVPENQLQQIPTGATAKTVDQQADNQRQDEALQHKMTFDWAKLDQQLAMFVSSQDQKQQQFAENQARLKKEFDEDVRQFNLKRESGYFTKNPKAQTSEIDKTFKKANDAIQNASVQLAGVEKSLEEKRAQLSALGDKDFGRYDVEKTIGELETKRSTLIGVRDAWQNEKRKMLPDISQARKEARAAIESGRDERQVRERFKKLYGEDV